MGLLLDHETVFISSMTVKTISKAKEAAQCVFKNEFATYQEIASGL